MHPATLHVMKYFQSESPEDRHTTPQPWPKEVMQPFADLANKMDVLLNDGPEKTIALRKLLEAQDAAVRAYNEK